MKSKGLFLCLLSGVLGLIGCAPKKMPEGDLIRVEYTRSGTMAGYEFEGRVEQDSAGSFVIRAMKESYGALYEKKVSPEVLQHFRQIITDIFRDADDPVFQILTVRVILRIFPRFEIALLVCELLNAGGKFTLLIDILKRAERPLIVRRIGALQKEEKLHRRFHPADLADLRRDGIFSRHAARVVDLKSR